MYDYFCVDLEETLLAGEVRLMPASLYKEEESDRDSEDSNRESC